MSDLDAPTLLARAKAETGLADWGDPSFEERLGLAVNHINGIPMDAAGRQAAADNINWLLTDRLKFFNDRKLYPLDQEVIDHPMFATGEPRSGTTLMHALMAVDPDARALRFWEVMHPSPPPGVAGDSHPGIKLAEQEWRKSTPRCGSGCTATPTTTWAATACPRTSAPGPSTSG